MIMPKLLFKNLTKKSLQMFTDQPLSPKAEDPTEKAEKEGSEHKLPSDVINIQQSVAILVDGNNIERSVHHLINSEHAMLNFDTVIPRLLSGRALNRLIYFKEGKSISSKLAERLHNLFYGQVQPCHKSADIPISIKATQLSSKVDTIIIMSGDSDYIELVSHLKSEGVRVEIAAVKETTAQLLIEHANYFHPLEREDLFVYPQKPHKTTKPSRQDKDHSEPHPHHNPNANQNSTPPPKAATKTPRKRRTKTTQNSS